MDIFTTALFTFLAVRLLVARASFTCEILHDIHEVALFLFFFFLFGNDKQIIET